MAPPPTAGWMWIWGALSALCWRGALSADFDEAPFALQQLRFSHPDATLQAHAQFGEEMGRRFAEGARLRLQEWDDLQKKFLPALQTKEGAALYKGFLEVHEAAFPEYMEELRGVARGAGLPFDAVFLAQIQEEFGGQLPGASASPRRPRSVDHCSDYMVCSEEHCVGGHNEDNNANSINRTFAVDAQLGGPETRFRAFVYMGELPSGAFGVNAAGIGFSLNWVGPPPAERPGLGRGFISRSLLDARSMDDALRRATVGGQASGHNIQLFDFCGRAIVNLEVAKEAHAVRQIGADAFFHANQYQTLDVPGQEIGQSSLHRIARAAQLPKPSSLGEILQVLGDQADVSYPIFHDRLSHQRGELSDWTMASAAFDLDASTVTILQGNPGAGRSFATWNVSELVGRRCEAARLIVVL